MAARGFAASRFFVLKQFLTSGILVQFVLDGVLWSARSMKCSGEDACDGSGGRSWHDNFQGLAVRDVRLIDRRRPVLVSRVHIARHMSR